MGLAVWQVITIDDKLPCYEDSKPVFAKAEDDELWVALIEKAMAKFCGSYASLKGGHTLWALHVLTGDHVFMLKKSDDMSREWRREDMRLDVTSAAGTRRI